MFKLKRLSILVLFIWILSSTVTIPCKASDYVPLTAQYAFAQSTATGRILYNKSAQTKVPMASTTKMMTAIIVIENCVLSDIVTVSKEASQITGSTMHLAQGETISVRALLYGLLLVSGNDAAVALAEHTAGSVENFCGKMNEKTQELDISNTHFTSPHGLDDNEHYTTAQDLAQIGKAFMKDPILTQICSTKQISIEGHHLTNTNPLLGIHNHVNGIKTGYTGNAGYCLVISAQNKYDAYIIVLLGCPSAKDRKRDAKKLTDHITMNYELYEILPRGSIVDTLPILDGNEKYVDIILPEKVTLTLTQEERQKLRFSFTPDTQLLNAPVSGGSVCGKFAVYTQDTCLYEGPGIALKSVSEKGFWAHFLEVVTRLIYLFS